MAADEESARQVVHEYVLDAIERLPETDACTGVSFAFDDHPETGASSVVALVLEGDADAIVANERDRWDSLTERGSIENWERAAVFDRDEITEVTEEYLEFAATISQLSARMTKVPYETLDTRPDPVDEVSERGSEDEPPIGWWSLLHRLTNQQNYSLEEELRVYEYGIEHALRNIAEYEGAETAAEHLDSHLESLESKRDDLLEGRLDS